MTQDGSSLDCADPGCRTKDFFISYTHADEQWADWIAYVLEESGFTTIVQVGDFRPGGNFVLEMQAAAGTADRTIMVLSTDYLNSDFASVEWAAAYASDPRGVRRKLLPVMVRMCSPKGLLATIVQIRLVGLDEVAARRALLNGLVQGRVKTPHPAFPGIPAGPGRMSHGGTAASLPPDASPLHQVPPGSRRDSADVEHRRFARNAFEGIKALFEHNLSTASGSGDRTQTGYRQTSPTDFTAEMYLDGGDRAACRIWLVGMLSKTDIGYSENSSIPLGAFNEVISLTRKPGELLFRALMPMATGVRDNEYVTERMTAGDVAEYLWDRFVSSLEC